MIKLYWGAFKRVTCLLLGTPKWLLLIFSIMLMSLVYTNGTIISLPVAVIDQDHTGTSKGLIRALSTSSKVSLVTYDNSLMAYEDINKRKIFAIITIPRHYEKRLLNGEAVNISAYGDASNRLANGMIQQDFKMIYQQVLINYNTKIMLNHGFTKEQAEMILTPIKSQLEPLYNAGISFAAITFPGLLVMLLQHSLLIASTRTNIALNSLPQGRPPRIIYLGSLSALIPIWLFLSIVLFGLWPLILGYRQNATLLEILLMTLPFLFAVMGFAKLLTECLRRVEMIYFTLAFITTPVFYLSGIIWPLDVMPYWVQLIAKLLPSTWAVNMIAGVNQMGLSVWDNGFNILMLICLGLFYTSLGMFISALRDGRVRRFFHYQRVLLRRSRR